MKEDIFDGIEIDDELNELLEPDDSEFDGIENEGIPAPDEPANLLDAMKSVLGYAHSSGLGKEYFRKAVVPLAYLCNRLSLTRMQATLLTVIMELGFHRRVTLSDLSRFLHTNNLTILEKTPALARLVERRFILEAKDRKESCYSIPQDVYDAFRRNEVYTHSIPILHDDTEMSSYLDRLLSNLDDDDNDYDTELFDRDVQEMLQANDQIHLAKVLLAAIKKFTPAEFRVLLLLSMFWIRDEDDETDTSRISIVIPRRFEMRQMVNAIQKGRSPLVTKKYVQAAEGDGLFSNGIFSLTPKFRHMLTPERDVKRKKVEESWSRNLTRHSSIQPKELFYNPEAEDQVRRLEGILEPDQMDSILERLKERGMRGGFTCLLYGGPGTGKTETVLQLAHTCGRDIFQIDVSQLRDKYYGESEKLVKNVFNQYRRMVKESKVAPIMFFNEADAIFNRRMENAARSVDKTENALQNIILQEMESLDGILFATTNLQGNLDDAFERRFLYKLRLDKPTPTVKARIWRSMLPDLTVEEASRLAGEFDFSGGQIENIVRKRFIDEVLTGDKLDINAVEELCRHELLDNSIKTSIGFQCSGVR